MNAVEVPYCFNCRRELPNARVDMPERVGEDGAVWACDDCIATNHPGPSPDVPSKGSEASLGT